jgi:23S rRNA (uridine2552-2'-O)-methyltransferase
VVDLGLAPGGWTQVAIERGVVDIVGVDLLPVEPLPPAQILQMDFTDPACGPELIRRLGGAPDVVLSDMAPKLTGVGGVDEARSGELVDAVVAALPTILRPGGRLLTKIFMGPGYDVALRTLRGLFTDVRVTRPEATRQGSAELYAFGRDYRPEKA